MIIDFIVPSKQIALHAPSVIVEVELGFEAELLLDRADGFVVEFEFEARKAESQFLDDLADVLFVLIIDRLISGDSCFSLDCVEKVSFFVLDGVLAKELEWFLGDIECVFHGYYYIIMCFWWACFFVLFLSFLRHLTSSYFLVWV